MTTLAELARMLAGELVGPGEMVIQGVNTLEEAGPGEIAFFAHPRYRKQLETTRASAVVVSAHLPAPDRPYIRVANAYLALAQLLEFFYPKSEPVLGVHPLATLGRNPRLGQRVSIYPGAVLGDEVELGDGVRIYPGVYVGDGVKIGAESILYPQVTIYPGVTLGRRVIIHAGSVIGSDGFGYAFDGQKHRKIPQVGGVVIEDEVEIGANVTIDRGTIGNTVIKQGTKIDNLVQIAHNVVVGEHSIIVAQVGISGSTRLGRGVMLGGQSGLVGHIQVGDGARVAAKAGVSKDVPRQAIISGFVGLPHTRWKRMEAALRRLPRLEERVRWLEQALAEREEKLEDRP